MEWRRAPAAAASAISAVLDDDDLLCEILLHVAFPTSLVRAALVCRRWLRLASAPAFLRRFRDLHPPSLLGFYVVPAGNELPRFVPLPQPPELAAVVSRASFDLASLGSDRFDVDCCNGLLLLTTIHMYPDRPVHTTRVRSPLHPARYTAVLSAVPKTRIHDADFTYDDLEILPRAGCGGGDGMSYFCLATKSKEQQTFMDVYVLRDDDVWAFHSSAVSEIPKIEPILPCTLLGDSKIYNVARVNNSYRLILLDLVSSSLSLLSFPEEMNPMSFELSLTDDSGLRLNHVKESQLRIWLHKMDDNGVSSWLLQGTVCLLEICSNSNIPACIFKDVGDSFAKVHVVAVSFEFVFLEMDSVLYLFDTKRKVANKVYDVTLEDKSLASVIPFMMVWPPKFPAIDAK
jgi:hypothetical protein